MKQQQCARIVDTSIVNQASIQERKTLGWQQFRLC